MYVYELARLFPSPDDYEQHIDRLLMYLAKYAHQDAIRLEYQPTKKLQKWATQIERLMKEEQDNIENSR